MSSYSVTIPVRVCVETGTIEQARVEGLRVMRELVASSDAILRPEDGVIVLPIRPRDDRTTSGQSDDSAAWSNWE